MYRSISRLILASAIFLSTSLPAFADNILLNRGFTTVKLSTELVSALTTLSVTPSGVLPTVISPRGAAIFPISTGVVENSGKGEIAHTGGLRLTAGSVKVFLSSFLIDTTGATPVLTGLVTVNDTLVGRAPLFNIVVSSTGGFSIRGRRVVGKGISLTLTDQAAQALNGSFSVQAFSAGIPIGTAVIRAFR
jgi:hypothetical protein